ncbi:uncharacterized protein LOC124679059 [Lolium rigidum]|uniref:uncharacterized protein LOC124679059 n=1 Tax=Lolium rigidum TaxID=89674 RepID=UPI001F5CDC10|nr:uncharacterized protein LOC124679059 [Lolium rigidum]
MLKHQVNTTDMSVVTFKGLGICVSKDGTTPVCQIDMFFCNYKKPDLGHPMESKCLDLDAPGVCTFLSFAMHKSSWPGELQYTGGQSSPQLKAVTRCEAGYKTTSSRIHCSCRSSDMMLDQFRRFGISC